jgi:photosystem II stability/assembly factor-like uncharacterized protein
MVVKPNLGCLVILFMSKNLIAFILLLLSLPTFAQHIEVLQQGKPTSIRGLSVVDDNIAWISGSKGHIAISTDGGKTWNWQLVKGFEKADFRDIEAFSSKEAIIMSSGTPALILKTTDGGANWQVKYHNADTAYFLDAMDFADKQHDYILGDPINNKFLLLETKDGGETWNPFKNPPDALPGEAAFAASGTCLRIIDKSLLIATGGNSSRLLTYSLKSNNWNYVKLAIMQGKASEGSFSLAIGKSQRILIGGDYSADKKTDSIAVIYTAHTFTYPITGPAGFQSCVEYIKDDIFLSTGTAGSNITTDGGKTWAKIDDTSYNVCRKARHGKLVLLAGNDGKMGILKL